jgi:hypothetical protein
MIVRSIPALLNAPSPSPPPSWGGGFVDCVSVCSPCGYDLNEKFSLFGSFGYVPIHTGRGSLVAYNIQLGGFRLTAGVLFLLK